jgi:hypothetical protein
MESLVVLIGTAAVLAAAYYVPVWLGISPLWGVLVGFLVFGAFHVGFRIGKGRWMTPGGY